MLYPVAREKLANLVARLYDESDAAKIPRPEIGTPPDREAALDEVDTYLSRFEEVDGLVDGHLAIQHNGRLLLVVDVRWPSPLRTLDGEETVVFKDAPAGPSRIGMWAVLKLVESRD